MSIGRDKITELRRTATCRCRAVAKKVNKVLNITFPGGGAYHPCCWVCCDCTIDRYDEEMSL